MKSSLEEIHVSLGARMTDFAGWNMPLRYGSALDEHHAVRSAAGLFDLSHMGEIDVVGPDAGAALDYSLIGVLSTLDLGQARYTMLCNEQGFVIDDLVVYRRSESRWTVVANASNCDTVAAALIDRCGGFDATAENRSADVALIAVQGPAAEEITIELAGDSTVADVRYYRSMEGRVADVEAHIARTGYTGEDGFELYVDPAAAPQVWEAAMRAGERHGIVPVGLAARDTLRLEAGMALYGHELDLTTTPFDARAGRMIKFDKAGDFVGRAALEALTDEPHRSLVGLQVDGKRPAREGYRVVSGGVHVGVLTSGTLSPTLGYPIALARLDAGVDPTSADLAVDVRGEATPASVVELPFYRRA